MDGKERVTKMLRREPIDRIPVYEHFWGDTYAAWKAAGNIKDESLDDYFDFDIRECWAFNLTADLDFKLKTVREDEDTITYLDGNGATLRRHKRHDTTPEHIDFEINTRSDWEEKIKPLLTANERRISFDNYRRARQNAEKKGKFFVWSGVNVFEAIHPVCGHVNMLMGMALDPEWIKDMANTYAELTVGLQKILFEKEGYPDGIWFYEDMGYKGAPFMSPDMYREIIMPAHKYTMDFAKSKGLPVIVHSCGFVEPLVESLIEAGMDCLQVIEVKAGMDLLKLFKLYGDKISFMGGIDVRKLYTNDRSIIDEELKEKIPVVKEGYGYCLHSDHSIPKTVDCEAYAYFLKRGIELGTY